MTERTSRKTGPAKGGKSAKAPAEPVRQNRARALSEIVPEIGGAAFRRFGFVQSAIISRWPEIVGQRFSGVSAPESIRFPAGKKSDGVLTLTVEGAHASMMQHVAPTLIDRVNRFFGYPAVARVQIRQGAAQPRPKPAPKPAPPSLKPVALGDSLRAVGDPELRAVLESLATGLAFTTGAPRLPEPSE
ncbi:DUF721 domain-containing protein [Nostoc sp. 3335mG]|nr:DUF721 domain-containing protein [Nostoc sp. 3335mG]